MSAHEASDEAPAKRPRRQRPEVARFERWAAEHAKECGGGWPHQAGESCTLPPPVEAVPTAHEDTNTILGRA
jgi:hypothetical protein